ncbi:MAG TPA: hypothetical protein VK466_09065 [Terriglobales bacterium]|nr:hypothetical protein [Terriglobales bacterium]
MTRAAQPAVTAFAVAMIALGILAVIYGDFALVWQPVAAWVPGRTALAYSSGVLMICGGAGLLFRRTAAASIRILFPYIVVWFLLKVPAVLVAPQVETVWLGIGELGILLTGGWVLFAKRAELPAGSPLAWLTNDRAIYVTQKVFGAALIPIGLSHLVYVKATADFVPGWLPYRVGWAYFTGAAQIAAGVGVLFGIFPRLAAMAEAAMIGLFTLLVWAPAIAAAPKARLPWTAFFISWVFGASAWVVAQSIATKRSTTRA